MDNRKMIYLDDAIDAFKKELTVGESKGNYVTICSAVGYEGAKQILERLPSVQSERLTDDDFETIRIHLQAHMEDLCNQHRWKEAQEYQRIIDKFMAFAQSETCKGCKHMGKWDNEVQYGYPSPCTGCKRSSADCYERGEQDALN